MEVYLLEVTVNTFCTPQNSNSVITIVSYVTFSTFYKTAFPSSNTAVLIRPISEHSQTFRAQKHKSICLVDRKATVLLLIYIFSYLFDV